MIGPDRHLALATWLENKERGGGGEGRSTRKGAGAGLQSTKAERILLMYSTIRNHSNHKMLIKVHRSPL